MIILPERNRAVGKILVPMRAAEWREPSKRINTFGIRNQTRWRLTARTDDGFIVWRGWFDDRDDADAFLFAAFTDSLHQERALWDLPSPAWRPGLDEALTYDFATVTFITSPLTVNTNYTIPSDWNSGNNLQECISAGGSGGGSTSSPQVPGAGGAGGTYAANTNYSATSGTLVNYQIGAGGAPVTTAIQGKAGGNTWFGAATFAASVCGAIAGTPAPQGVSNNTSAGGPTASCFGNSTRFKGGDGVTGTAAYVGTGGGGGGAAGPNGAGGEGGRSSSGIVVCGGGGGGANGGANGGNNTSTTGGVGGNNRLGSGGGAAGTGSAHGQPGTNGAGGGGAGTFTGQIAGNGGDGTEWDATHGSGGGGGSAGSTTYKSGAGGKYGGGGGGSLFGTVSPGTGAGGQGILVITYTPNANRALGIIPWGF